MKLLQLKQQIHKFECCKDFIEAFNVGQEDCIFTNKFLYETFLKNLNINCIYVFQEDYNLREPSDDIMDKIIRYVQDKGCKRIIGIGGGSIIDISKVLSLKNITSTRELFEKSIPAVKARELIIVPTTCGTGSEVTNISIAEIKSKGTKLGLAVDELYADYAVLIPELVKGLPYEFFVYSSIDALIHAIESFVSPKANAYTEMFSVEAIKMIINGYKEVQKSGKDYRKNIIEEFLIASNYAGIAFGNAGVGAVHALSYPLGGKYHVPHGEANYQFFIEVFKFYKEKNPNGKIDKLNELLSSVLDVSKDKVYEELEKLLGYMIEKKPLNKYGMKEEEIYSFPKSVLETQQRLLGNNYVEMKETDMIDIYKKLF